MIGRKTEYLDSNGRPQHGLVMDQDGDKYLMQPVGLFGIAIGPAVWVDFTLVAVPKG